MAAANPVGSVEGLGARTLALRPSARRRLRRRLLAPFMRTDPVQWHNTARGVRLFVRAAFSGLGPRGLPVGDHDRIQSALFCFGAIAAAARLGRLSPFARKRAELALLRRAYGHGPLDARWMRRELHRRAETSHDGLTLEAGRVALLDWLRGCDPAPILRDVLDGGAIEHRPVRERPRAPRRQRSGLPAVEPLRARR